ncbi:MAG TPA: EF-hand domain-containing protein [Paraburkholderia sp.]|jgi:Ca2+-binding EF-hand superfamily protein
MSVSSINTPADLYRDTQRGSAGGSGSAGAQGAGASQDAGSAAASASSTSASVSVSSSPSSIVTLSPQGQSIADLASKGITVTEVSLASLGISPDQVAQAKTPAQAAALMEEVNKKMQEAGDTPKQGGAVSEQDFDNLIEKQLGGTKAQADQLFAAFDSNNDGSISNSEMLNELGSLTGDSTSPAAQTLLGLMDSNHDGAADSTEFIQFETSFVQQEKVSST